ncbi:dihydropteroate synthase, partial [uncultured Campylobacter sp.]|uniref:dihydropteroate synthase n=1 Tax=uncultured Campylobacter sp. TaxID=218934 RepID=UPI00262C5CF9
MALGKVSSLGFGSQVLTQDVIDKLKAADEAGQIKPVTAKITANATKQKDLTALKTLIGTFRSSVSTLADDSSYQKRTTSSDGKSADISASAGVAVQDIEIDVKQLAKKEKLQDFGLKKLAGFLESKFTKPAKPLIMGVVNINTDSFNEQSRINTQNGIAKIESMIGAGADYIDLGGVSSRPGSEYCGREEEFRRIKDIIEEIYRLNLHEKAKFSLDSFDPYCLEFALSHGFKMINDITANASLATLAARYDAEFCMMHMQGDPATMQVAPKYNDLIGEIADFFEQKMALAKELGAKKLVLDVGIGFGKTAEQN